MSFYVGLDVSVKSVSICVVNAEGAILARGETTSDPSEISSVIDKHAPNPERVVHESGILAIWLTRELEKHGLPIICIDARLAHKALSVRINKSDPGDAEGLAHLARTGWFSKVHIRSEASERVCVLIGTRERLIRMRKDLEGHVRGVLTPMHSDQLARVKKQRKSMRADHPLPIPTIYHEIDPLPRSIGKFASWCAQQDQTFWLI